VRVLWRCACLGKEGKEMEKLELTCYRFKGEKRFQDDVVDEQERAEAESRPVKPPRKTIDVRCRVTPYYRKPFKEGQRMVKMRFGSGREYHIPARDFVLLLSSLEFDVRDARK